ncbi:ABC transporter substrate-binding protein [Pseudomonas sp. JDS28PS106]|uniref:substrate-binding periplasmic protein n=1 Tax=Pseudomonas sp. JDS28PS106 TaxID=2497235 RepID=UPI002FD0C205
MNLRLKLSLCLVLALLALHSRADSIIVVTEDSSYAYLRGGRVAGPGTQVVERVLKKAVFDDYRIQLYPWARAYEKALREPNVLIYPMIRTSARESLFKWVGEIGQAQTRLYRLREERDITPSSLIDARRFSVGVVRDDSRQLYLQAQGFARLVVSTTNRDSFQKLLNHQVQLLPMSEREARLLSDEARVDFTRLEAVGTLDQLPASIYMAFSLDTPDDVVTRARAAFEQLKVSGEIDRLLTDSP